ncbi:MAG TPA: hypothetical protein VIK03_02935 [Thermoleophilia bacterium]
MSLLPDPAELYAAADHIGRHADALRAHAAHLASAAANARWESPAARAFRAKVDTLGHDMFRAANRIDDAAETLRRHAGRIETELALERALVHGAEGLAHDAERLAHGAVHDAQSVARGALQAGGSLLSLVGL